MLPLETTRPGALAGAAGPEIEADHFDVDVSKDKLSARENPPAFAVLWLRRRFGLPPQQTTPIGLLTGLGSTDHA